MVKNLKVAVTSRPTIKRPVEINASTKRSSLTYVRMIAIFWYSGSKIKIVGVPS